MDSFIFFLFRKIHKYLTFTDSSFQSGLHSSRLTNAQLSDLKGTL